MTDTSPLRIALATSQRYADLSPGDRLLMDALREKGHAAMPLIWNDPAHARAGKVFDAVVIRSTWDYHVTPAAFLHWVRQLDTDGTCLINPIATIEGNIDKRYLVDLQAAGHPVVPTHVTKRGTAPDLAEILDTYRWTDAVVKPRVSASADRTWRVDRTDVTPVQRQVDRAHTQETGWLVQPFIDEIPARGEWSLIYLGGRYSHAVLKRPGHGDYRSQAEHGGSVEVIEPDPGARRLGDTMATLYSACAYLRVDLVETRKGPLVMEIEAIEPELFLERADHAASQCADAIVTVASAPREEPPDHDRPDQSGARI